MCVCSFDQSSSVLNVRMYQFSLIGFIYIFALLPLTFKWLSLVGSKSNTNTIMDFRVSSAIINVSIVLGITGCTLLVAYLLRWVSTLQLRLLWYCFACMHTYVKVRVSLCNVWYIEENEKVWCTHATLLRACPQGLSKNETHSQTRFLSRRTECFDEYAQLFWRCEVNFNGG